MGAGHQRVEPDHKWVGGPRRIGARTGDHVANSFPRLKLLIKDHTMDNKGAYDVVHCIKGGVDA